MTVTGHVANAPELRTSQSGTSVLQITIAHNHWRKDDSKEQETSWFRFTAFGETADKLAKFLTKGSLVMLRGEPKLRKRTDGDEKGYWFEVTVRDYHMLDRAKREDDDGEEKPKAPKKVAAKPPEKQQAEAVQPQAYDDIPF